MSPQIDPKVVGLFIARKREELGMSQAALARAASISRPYLSQIESGSREPSDDVFMRLLTMLGSPLDELVRDVYGPALEPAEQQAMLALLEPQIKLSQTLAPEVLLDLMSQMTPLEQLAENLAVLSPDPIVMGPEGWSELGKEDRRLVQRLVNRLRKAPEAE